MPQPGGGRVQFRQGAVVGQTALMQHRQSVAKQRGRLDVMGDEDLGHLAPKALEQAQHLRLDGSVQRAHGLVENEQVGPAGQRPRDADALQLSAAQLMRQAGGQAGR